MALRFFALSLLFTLSYGLLGLNLYRLQVDKSDYYFEKAQARSEILAGLELRRGQIFFTDRYQKQIPVALNRDYPVIYAVPKEIKNVLGTANLLAPIVQKNEGELKESLNNPKSLFKLLAHKASKEQIDAIKSLGLEGIYLDKKQYRFFPFEKLGSHLLGFVGINEENDNPVGLYGLEKLHEGTLAKGEDIKLTIDRNLQAHGELVLSTLIEKFSAEGGTIIIEDPNTGAILTLANAPNFDPNAYSQFPVKNFLNPAVGLQYEPGSVFKPITMAAGIDSHVFTPETTFIDKGSITLNGKTIKNWDNKSYGKITMTNVLEKSVNTGAVYAEQKIGHGKFYDYLKKFGFGEETNIDLPDEIKGSLKNLEKKDARAIDFATASFGQGTAVTPIQLINAFSSFANGGLLMRPYVNITSKPYVVRRVMNEETARVVTQMMESAVEKARVAQIPEYRVAGKTGTAQIPNFLSGGYTDEFIHTYIGFAPASNAKFVILIKLDKPSASLAGETVVPAFRELAQFVLNYYNIPPDKLEL